MMFGLKLKVIALARLKKCITNKKGSISMFWHFSALEQMYPHFGEKNKIKKKKKKKKKKSLPCLIFQQ